MLLSRALSPVKMEVSVADFNTILSQATHVDQIAPDLYFAQVKGRQGFVSAVGE